MHYSIKLLTETLAENTVGTTIANLFPKYIH